MEVGPREYFFAQGVTKMDGKYRVTVVYWFDGETYESHTGHLFRNLNDARSEKEEILRSGIEDKEHGLIPLTDLIEVRIEEKTVQYKDVTNAKE